MPTLERLTTALADRYRIERELGAGGMATVYLAHDHKHDRQVAIKVLHPDLGAALGSERFLGEIRTTARLQHPHVLPLLDSGDAGHGLLYYVMPLATGETLRDRLTREKQLPIDDAVRIAREVADALGHAHAQGIIHRDIKPENILLQGGHAMVADFGIALAVQTAAGQRMTQTGLSLGTPQYMSPEQAMGERTIDARSDVYALGAVTYEMLVGDPPFTGSTVQAIVARVLTERPTQPTAIRDTVPRHVEAAVLKALAKLPADRFPEAAQFAAALAQPDRTTYATSPTATVAGGSDPAGPARRWRRLAVAGWVVGAGALAAALWMSRASRREPAALPPVVKAEVPTATQIQLPTRGAGVVISPNGAEVAYVAPDSTVRRWFVQSLATGLVERLPRAESFAQIWFSPDGHEFGSVRKRDVLITSRAAGGERTVLANLRDGIAGAVWGTDSVITVAASALLRVPATGGRVDTIAPAPKDPVERYLDPSLSADGTTVFGVRARQGAGTGTVIAVSLADRGIKEVGITGSKPVLVGRTLTYGTPDGVLWGVDYDIDTHRPQGAPRVLASDIAVTNIGTLRADVSPATGTVVLVEGRAVPDKDLVLFDRTGRAEVVSAVPRRYFGPRFSPDGTRLAVNVSQGDGRDIWTLTLANGMLQRFTTDTLSSLPAWDHDGRGLLFIRIAAAPGFNQVYWAPIDGSASPVLIASHPAGHIWEAVMTPDGRRVVYRVDMPGANRDIFIAARDGGEAPIPIIASRFDEKSLALSPDGQWLAYASDETGANEVYIVRLDAPGRRWPVSQRGGNEPRWARTGELFFRRGDSVFVTRVSLGAEPSIPAPTFLFAARFDESPVNAIWDVSTDGKRFVGTRSARDEARRLMVLLNAVDPRP